MDTSAYKGTVFARFTDSEILDEMGRLLYSILNVFSVNGYQVQLFDNIDFGTLDKYGQMVPSMAGLSLVDVVPDETAEMIYLFDTEDSSCATRGWRKKIQVRFDIFSNYRLSSPVILPYPVHPLHSGPDLPERLESLRKNDKKVRIFFSGDTKGYTKNRIHYPDTKLPRLMVIETILDKLAGNTVHVEDTATLDNIFNGDHTSKCVIVDTGKMWVDPAEWLPRLSKADFFICPPGYVMPMCHNVIEAMAVGAIPVINYPEWLTPTLVHMENCITFSDRDDLVRNIRHILDMDAQEVSDMRDRVIDYYETHLKPERFIAEIESRKEEKTTVLMITDRNTVRNASKLDRNSVLIRGAPAPHSSRWSRFLHAISP